MPRLYYRETTKATFEVRTHERLDISKLRQVQASRLDCGVDVRELETSVIDEDVLVI